MIGCCSGYAQYSTIVSEMKFRMHTSQLYAIGRLEESIMLEYISHPWLDARTKLKFTRSKEL